MRRTANRDAGLSLVETLVALTVFAIVSAALSGIILNTIAVSRTDRARVVAASLATREVESVREEAGRRPVVQLEQGGSTSTRTVGETTYTVRRTATWTATSATGDSCTSNAGVSGNAYLRVAVEVTWPRMGDASPARADTLLTPAIGTYSAATGNVAVKVVDRDGNGGEGHVVALQGAGEPVRQTTTAEGCAFFAFVKPGTYTVSLGTARYVDPSGDPAPEQTTTIVAAAPTAAAVSFTYDREVPVTFVDADPAFPLAPPVGPETIVVGNDRYQPTKTLPLPFSARPFAAALFPWRDGVAVWAGACADAQPETPPRLTLTPGTPLTADVPAARVEVTVTRGGVPAGGISVTATADSESCPAGDSRTLGTTGSDGRVRASLPYGAWTLTAGGAAVPVTLSASASEPATVTVEAP